MPPTGESILVVVDYYSRFLEVTILKSARFCVPFSLKTDNGLQFGSKEFELFLQAHDVEHLNDTTVASS